MTPLRQKMLDIMHFQNLSHRTCQSYLFSVSTLAKYYDRSPELIAEKEVLSWIMARQKNIVQSIENRHNDVKVIGIYKGFISAHAKSQPGNRRFRANIERLIVNSKKQNP